MVHTQESEVRTAAVLPPLAAQPPVWVSALIGSTPYAVVALTHTALGSLHAASVDGVTHATTSILDAASLSPSALEQAVAAAYHALAGALAQAGAHPVRFWNFIPGIHAAMDETRDRYMVFNAGRFAAFSSWYGSPAAFSQALATASAVGVREGPLVVHALGLDAPGAPIENPRQIPAYSYSRRYGPRPPCFARATRVQAPGSPRPWLLVGGTASILGEDSIHARDVRRQAVETFENLSRLVLAGRAAAAATNAANGEVATQKADTGKAAPAKAAGTKAVLSQPAGHTNDALSAFKELRVYVVRPCDAEPLRAMVADRFPRTARVEYAQADLCRQELLVEIEGVAEL